jgi:putative membrane protein
MAAVGRRWGWAALISIVLVLLAPARVWAADVPVPPEGLLSDRAKGALSDADRDFVVKVRLAGLWEIPAGEMAQGQSVNPRIQQIGRDIAGQHRELDALTRAAAKKLNVALPGTPNSDQQGWLAEMRDAQGTSFDTIYIARLRAAHGKIFPAIATIRASTRNDTVRKLAQQANQFVMTHMTLLESSGIVDFGVLPTAPAPSAATGVPQSAAPVLTSAEQRGPAGSNLLAVIAALVGGLAAGIFATYRIVGNRRPAYRSRRVRY